MNNDLYYFIETFDGCQWYQYGFEFDTLLDALYMASMMVDSHQEVEEHIRIIFNHPELGRRIIKV